MWKFLCGGNFHVFRDIAFFGKKIPPRKNKTHVTLLRKKEMYSESHPLAKGLLKNFREFFPQ